MTEPQLHDALDRATDRVDSPGLAATALVSARRRQVRRRGLVAAGVSSAVVAAVVLGVVVGGAPLTGDPAPQPDGPVKVWPDWDPYNRLPQADAGVAPGLPRTPGPAGDAVEVVRDSPDLRASPVDAAVIVVRIYNTGHVLGTDGSWRRVPMPGEEARVALSPRGTRLVTYERDGERATRVYDLATGESRKLVLPEGVAGPFGSWQFLSEDRVLFDRGDESVVVDAATGAARPARFSGPGGLYVDDAGDVVALPGERGPAELVDYRGKDPRHVAMDRTGRLASIAVNGDTIAGTVFGTSGEASVVVADRATLTPTARLPVVNARVEDRVEDVSVMALCDDGTVLLRTGDLEYGLRSAFTIVAWDPETGEIGDVARMPQGPRDVALASELVRAGLP